MSGSDRTLHIDDRVDASIKRVQKMGRSPGGRRPLVAVGEGEPAGSEKGSAAETRRGNSGNNIHNNGKSPKVLTRAVRRR
jgi:hypothetical protein